MKSPQKQHIHHIIFIFLLMILGWGQSITKNYNQEIIPISENEKMIISNHEMEGYTFSDTSYISFSRLLPPCDDGYTEIDGECYYQSDLDVLQEFINSNDILIGMEPWEIGNQYWNNGRIFYLYLLNINLTSEIPYQIGNLTHLSHFYLIYCNLTGEIPSEIGNLSNLINLYFLGNNFIGEIPSEIGNLSNLTSLNLVSNNLSGEIPPEIGNLSNLTNLSLSYTNLTGEIPSEIGNLTNLTDLRLVQNQLSGNIPTEIGNLTNLNGLWLLNNQLSGDINDNICDLPIDFDEEDYWELEFFNISNNYFCSHIPNCIQEKIGTQFCENINCDVGYSVNDFCLSDLDLSVLQEFINNSLETIDMNMDDDGNGIIEPLELGIQEWENGRLTHLSCYQKGLSLIPEQVIDLTNLKELFLSVNLLTEIPSEIWELSNLTGLGLNGNQLTGEIPSSVGNLTNLTTLVLSSNQLTGEIPSSVGNLTNLTYLDLLGNNFSGDIPLEILNLTNLKFLYLRYNQLSGEIPQEIGQLTNLFELLLGNNQLSGEIPINLCNIDIDNMNYFNISPNQLCPPYPECIEDYVGYQDTSECPPEYQLGDVNQDTEINISDIILIVQFVLGEQPTEQQFILSDWTEDGEINIVDIVQMVYYILNN